MKVLHIVEAFGGGLFSFLVELVNQSPDDFEITIAYAMRPQTPDDFKSYFKKKVCFIEVKHFQRSVNPVNDILAGFELRGIVKNVNPDLIHMHSSKAGVIGRLFINENRYPVIYTPHGYSFLKKDDSALKRKIYYFAEWLGGRGKSLTVACSKGEWEEAQKVARRAEYINNGINYKVLPEAVPCDWSRKIEIVMVGRICYQKNPRMFNEVAKQFPQYIFRWIGEGEMRDELDAPNIIVTGWISRQETLEYINRAHVFFLPSLWEGLPISLLEAMYLKKLCIVNNAVGNRDVIQNGVNGYLVENVDQCIDILRDLEQKAECNDKLIERALQDIVTEYNVEKMGGRYAEKYRKFYEEYNRQ